LLVPAKPIKYSLSKKLSFAQTVVVLRDRCSCKNKQALSKKLSFAQTVHTFNLFLTEQNCCSHVALLLHALCL
jgi:hypothetical protein